MACLISSGHFNLGERPRLRQLPSAPHLNRHSARLFNDTYWLAPAGAFSFFSAFCSFSG
ncbi:protein of unknown function [Burkholderia multivorans]